jgi:23S rRNA pseudouridine2457 synthase
LSTVVLFNKPYGVLSQFTSQDGFETLATYIKQPHLYAAGRLDKNSEGLLILTDDGRLQHRISAPKHKMTKTYWVQVEGCPAQDALLALRQGVALKDGLTRPATARIIEDPPIWERVPPIRTRQTIPTTWMEILLTEGRNRQVRRMTAAVGHPTLRLIRAAIGPWSLGDLQPGTFRTVAHPG